MECQAPKGASPEAAAAAAAHRVLRHYFGTGAGDDARCAARRFIGPRPGRRAEGPGHPYGIRAADRIIALRANDGRERDSGRTAGRRTRRLATEPPAFAAFTTAWLGQVTPLAIRLPDPVRSRPAAADRLADLHRRIRGGARPPGSNAPLAVRSVEMTQTAMFFSDAGISRCRWRCRRLPCGTGSTSTTAPACSRRPTRPSRMGPVTVWNAKLQYLWWRPVTAIRELTERRHRNLRAGCRSSPRLRIPTGRADCAQSSARRARC